MSELYGGKGWGWGWGIPLMMAGKMDRSLLTAVLTAADRVRSVWPGHVATGQLCTSPQPETAHLVPCRGANL